MKIKLRGIARIVALVVIAAPWVAEPQGRSSNDVLTVGEVVRIDNEGQTFVMESAPVGVLRASTRPVNGSAGSGGIEPFPPPEDATTPGPRISRPGRRVIRPVYTRIPIDPGSVLDNRTIEDPPVREGYRRFGVGTTADTEYRQNGNPVDFETLEVGDHVAVLGTIDGDTIAASRVDRTPPAEEGR